jgi:hypothetical protein
MVNERPSLVVERDTQSKCKIIFYQGCDYTSTHLEQAQPSSHTYTFLSYPIIITPNCHSAWVTTDISLWPKVQDLYNLGFMLASDYS